MVDGAPGENSQLPSPTILSTTNGKHSVLNRKFLAPTKQELKMSAVSCFEIKNGFKNTLLVSFKLLLIRRQEEAIAEQFYLNICSSNSF